MSPRNTNAKAEDHAQEQGMAEKARATAARGFDEAQERATAAAHELEKTVRHSADTGASFIRENPGIALAGAVGIGVLIGLAVGKSDRRAVQSWTG